MKRVVVLLLVVLFIVCIGVVIISCNDQSQNQNSQNQNFVEDEKQLWENQEKNYCAERFGFIFGQGFFTTREKQFNWVAFADSDLCFIFKFDRLFSQRIVESLSSAEENIRTDSLSEKFKPAFNVFAEEGHTVIKTTNNWFSSQPPIRPDEALLEKINLMSKMGLNLEIFGHETHKIKAK